MSQSKSLIARWKSISFPNKVNVICTSIIAVATVFYTVIARNQLGEMQKQLKVTQRALTDTQHSSAVATDQTWQAIGNINWLARSMDTSAHAAGDAATEAKTSRIQGERQSKAALDASIAASRNDQRAWVGLSSVNTDGGVLLPPGGRPQFQIMMLIGPPGGPSFAFKSVAIILHNSGKTPALDINADCCFVVRRDFRISDIPEYDDIFAQFEATQRTRIPPPNGDIISLFRNNQSAQFASHGGVLPPDVSRPETVLDGATQWNILIQGSPPTDYILGKIIYSDVFPGTNRHVTTICLVRKAQDKFDICSGGGTIN